MRSRLTGGSAHTCAIVVAAFAATILATASASGPNDVEYSVDPIVGLAQACAQGDELARRVAYASTLSLSRAVERVELGNVSSLDVQRWYEGYSAIRDAAAHLYTRTGQEFVVGQAAQTLSSASLSAEHELLKQAARAQLLIESADVAVETKCRTIRVSAHTLLCPLHVHVIHAHADVRVEPSAAAVPTHTYQQLPTQRTELPATAASLCCDVSDHGSCSARFRIVVHEPTQLLSNGSAPEQDASTAPRLVAEHEGGGLGVAYRPLRSSVALEVRRCRVRWRGRLCVSVVRDSRGVSSTSI